MRLENAVASDVLERILSAYGFTMQKELSDKLEIAKSNVASWLARGQVPGNVIVQCSLDTGADVNWLVTGEIEKANSLCEISNLSGKAIYEEVMANGGKPVLRRILDAYGFTLQKQLCELLDISSGTVSTWVRRNYFPGDVVVTCALDTGVSLRWLATGKGTQKNENSDSAANFTLPHKRLNLGKLEDLGTWQMNLSFISYPATEPVFISSSNSAWIVDIKLCDISNGKWLLGIDDKYDIYDVTVLPGKKLNVTSNTTTFTCSTNEVRTTGKVILTMDYNM